MTESAITETSPSEEAARESNQFWSIHELDDEKIEKIADPIARAHARSAFHSRQAAEGQSQ